MAWFIFLNYFYVIFDWQQLTQMRELSWCITHVFVAFYVLMQKNNFVIQIWLFIAVIALTNSIAGLFNPDFYDSIQAGSTLFIVASFILFNLLRLKFLIILEKTIKLLLKLTEKTADVYHKYKLHE